MFKEERSVSKFIPNVYTPDCSSVGIDSFLVIVYMVCMQKGQGLVPGTTKLKRTGSNRPEILQIETLLAVRADCLQFQKSFRTLRA